MNKKKLEIEYPLSSKSESIVWGLIGNAHGLSKWMAEHVEEVDGVLTVTWGEVWTQQDIRTSVIIERRENSFIRLKWDVNPSDDDFWELRVGKSDFSGKLTLLITDHVDEDDYDYMKGVWADNLNRLHNVSGL